MKSIEATLMRGGTSKGVFLREEQLSRMNRDFTLVKLLGSPDPLQVDGLGGGFSSTSKAMIVKKAKGIDAAVEYLFAQVHVDKARVDYSGNCGNLTSAVGPFAVDDGLMRPMASNDPRNFQVRMFNENTEKYIVSTFEVKDGRTNYKGGNAVEGVPSSGVRVKYRILDPAGTVKGTPIIEPSLKVDFEGKKADVSVVDVSSVYAFVRSDVIGLSGTELPPAVNSDANLLSRVEQLRRKIKKSLGRRLPAGDEESPLALRIVFVSQMKGHVDWLGRKMVEDDADILVRAFSMGKMHHAIPFTAALCIAAASKIPGTQVNEVVRRSENAGVRIAHPKGIAETSAEVSTTRGIPKVEYVEGARTARVLMRGTAYVEA